MTITYRIHVSVALILSFLLAGISPLTAHEAYAEGLFWSSTSSPTSIGRSDVDGTAVQTSFVVSAANVYGVAQYGSYLYLAADTNIARASVDGTSINNAFITGLTMVSAIAVTSQYIFWADGQYIGRADLNGGNVVYRLYDAGWGCMLSLPILLTYILRAPLW